MAVFGSLWIDIPLAFIFGALGGIAAELVDLNGDISIPHKESDNTKKFNYSLGLLSKVIVGGIAALALFFIVDTTDAFKFVGATVVAGFGGSATLVAAKEKLLGNTTKNLAEAQANDAQKASETISKLATNLEQLQQQPAAAQFFGVGGSPQMDQTKDLVNEAKQYAAYLKESSAKVKDKIK